MALGDRLAFLRQVIAFIRSLPFSSSEIVDVIKDVVSLIDDFSMDKLFALIEKVLNLFDKMPVAQDVEAQAVNWQNLLSLLSMILQLVDSLKPKK